ncbi:MAG TPA: hypothetical protein VKV21_06590 [Solirubrobacteraceae bacterium]|nr:hypothetical protein [Solirubrobacteraceae bacterium]
MRMTRTFRGALTLLVACLAAAAALGGCGGAHRERRHATRSRTATPASPTSTTPSPPAAPGVVYGIGDAQGRFAGCAPGVARCCSTVRARCELSRLRGFFDNPLFLRLITPASAHRVRDVRLFVDYDAVQQWNGSTTAPGCEYSRTIDQPYYDLADGWHTPGQSINDLVAGVIEARAEGLTPVVSIEGFSYATATPPGDAPFPDPTTVGGYWEYRCGLLGILGVLSRLPAWMQPHDWEPLNEPEGFRIFRSADGREATSCAVSAAGQPDGPAKAACAEVVASRLIHGYVDHAHDTVIAGTFKHPYASYLAPYADLLAREMPGAAFPRTWSVHDYPEVTGAYAGASPGPELASFDAALARDTDGRAKSLWVTEAGTVLTSLVRDGACPAVGVDPAGSLGACVNGDVGRQTADAEAFFALPHVATAVPITHLFWYQFQGASHWDSGLIDAAGRPRVAYCVFYGQGTCDGSPDAS